MPMRHIVALVEPVTPDVAPSAADCVAGGRAGERGMGVDQT
jgi:hypothetical protein